MIPKSLSSTRSGMVAGFRKRSCSNESGRSGRAPDRKRERFMTTDTLSNQLDTEMITKAYARWAPVYDLVFGAVFERGRAAAIEAAERIGGRILEVGVGTGISLPDYSDQNTIYG